MPRSWRGRGPVCCAGGQSTRTGWSYPGPQPPLQSGTPARPPRGPQSRTAPGPTALAVGGKQRGPTELGAGRLALGPAHGRDSASSGVQTKSSVSSLPRRLPCGSPETSQTPPPLKVDAGCTAEHEVIRTPQGHSGDSGLGLTDMELSKPLKRILENYSPSIDGVLPLSSNDKQNGSVPTLTALRTSTPGSDGAQRPLHRKQSREVREEQGKAASRMRTRLDGARLRPAPPWDAPRPVTLWVPTTSISALCTLTSLPEEQPFL